MSVDERIAAEPQWNNGQLNALAGLDLPAPLRKLVDKHTETFAAWNTAGALAQQANDAALRAIGEDAENRAQAIVKGRPAPRPTAPAANERLADALQKTRDLARACCIVEAAIPAAVADHQTALLAQLDNEAATARATIHECVATLTDALMVLARQTRLRPVVQAPYDPRSWTPSWPAPTLLQEVTDALATIGRYGNEPRQLTPLEDYQANAVPGGSYSGQLMGIPGGA